MQAFLIQVACLIEVATNSDFPYLHLAQYVLGGQMVKCFAISSVITDTWINCNRPLKERRERGRRNDNYYFVNTIFMKQVEDY